MLVYKMEVLFLQSMAYSRVITPSQFGRILTFLSINVNQEDFRLLCRKFADPTTGDVNYPAFVQTVDKGRGRLYPRSLSAVNRGTLV